MLYLKACPKCGGALELHGTDLDCLNCGFSGQRCGHCGSVAVRFSGGFSCKCGWSRSHPSLVSEPHLPGEDAPAPAGPETRAYPCTVCGEPKPASAFSTTMQRRGRYRQSACRACRAAHAREHRARARA